MITRSFPLIIKATLCSVLLACVVACSSTSDSGQSSSKTANDPKYNALQAKDNLMDTNQISGIKIFEARYPFEAAKKSLEGCATIEYVITEDLNISNIKVVSASNADFAASAVTNIKRAKFENFQLVNHSLPIKLHTKFDFCLQEEDVTCQEKAQTKVCKGQDTLYSIGSIVRRVSR